MSLLSFSVESQILPPLPKREPGASDILKIVSSSRPDHESSVAEHFARAGFPLTKPYIPKHDLDPLHAILNGRDPNKAKRVVLAAGRSAIGGIRNDYELIAIRRHRRQMLDEWGNKPTPEAVREWADLHFRSIGK